MDRIRVLRTYGTFFIDLFGSAGNSFWNKNSDVDVCIIFHKQLNLNQVSILNKIYKEIKVISKESKIIRGAHVPIIKFKDKASGLDVDLCCNNPLGLANSRLIYCYAQYD